LIALLIDSAPNYSIPLSLIFERIIIK
jgi:hypothetical protein